MLSSYRLSLKFDPTRLQDDLALIRPDEWIAHFNKADYDGAWSGVSLRSVGGATTNIYPGATAAPESFADTSILARCPYFTEVIRQFHCPVRSARLLRLCPGSIIREHRDPSMGLEDGEARFHVPVMTNPDVAFFVNGERVTMNPGEAWYIDFNLPHRVSNLGSTDRIHLVIDCVVNDWVLGLFPPEMLNVEPEAPPLESPSSPEALERFRVLVAEDDRLQEELRDILDPALFVSQVLKLGALHDCRFAAVDVQEAVRTARRAWLERNLPW